MITKVKIADLERLNSLNIKGFKKDFAIGLSPCGDCITFDLTLYIDDNTRFSGDFATMNQIFGSGEVTGFLFTDHNTVIWCCNFKVISLKDGVLEATGSYSREFQYSDLARMCEYFTYEDAHFMESVMNELD